MTEDVVKEALENLETEPTGFVEDDIAVFLQHILEAGPDERMVENRVGIRVRPGRLIWNLDEQKRLLSHLIERLQEQSE